MYKKNISNIQLAEMLYVSPSTVSGYRTGRRSPSVNELAEIGQILDVSVDFLIGNSDTEKK
ncbi:MAG: helix-turn-helix domain-containing protein [Agathobacter sp.]|nr:helix-turn-helix domain-containing protein [Agathobacter sp.]